MLLCATNEIKQCQRTSASTLIPNVIVVLGLLLRKYGLGLYGKRTGRPNASEVEVEYWGRTLRHFESEYERMGQHLGN